MASQRQIEANRRNALKSTGPRTSEGKTRSRLNALRHGLAVSSEGGPKACDALHARLHQIDVAHAKILADCDDALRQGDLEAVHAALVRLSCLESYLRRAYAQLKKAPRETEHSQSKIWQNEPNWMTAAAS